jgi:putative PIN family toxin of toxin-antitoxin system
VRVVVDLNVFVSALINPAGVPARVVRLGLSRRYELVTCPRLLDELEEVLHRPAFRRYFTAEEAEEFVGAVAGVATEAPEPAEVNRVSRDPADDYLVALAVLDDADRVVTGDPDLLEVADPPVHIVAPAVFLAELENP